VYDEVEEGIVCRQDFRASCEVGLEYNSFDAEEVKDCRDSWNIDECLESEQMKKFSSWCTSSSEAVGEYAIPLLTFQEFETGEGDVCGSTEYTHLLLPDENGACIPHSFLSRNAEGDLVNIDGTRQGSCNGSVFNAVRYESTDCTGDAEKTFFDGSSDECPSSSDVLDYTYTNNCGAPTIYCKALPFLAGASEDNAADDVGGETDENVADDVGEIEENVDGNGGETLPASAAGHDAAMGGLLVVGVALTSWIA